jgi:uncharacterized protein
MHWLFAALIAAMMLAPCRADAGEYSPLNCSKAGSAAEITICTSYSLGQDEARMATLYAIATSLVGMGRRGDITDAQHDWIKQREACGGKIACLTQQYDARIGALNAVIAEVASHGPF